MMRAERGRESMTAGALQSQVAWHMASLMKSVESLSWQWEMGGGGGEVKERGSREKEGGMDGGIGGRL